MGGGGGAVQETEDRPTESPPANQFHTGLYFFLSLVCVYVCISVCVCWCALQSISTVEPSAVAAAEAAAAASLTLRAFI